MFRYFFIAAILSVTSAAALAESPLTKAQLVTSLRVSFGGVSRPTYSIQAGSSFTALDELQPFKRDNAFFVSGISYTSSLGFTPVLFGANLVPRVLMANAAEESGGLPWGWIGAGAAAVVGVVIIATSGSGNDQPQDRSGATPENSCVFAGDNLSNPNVNPNQCSGGIVQ